MKKGGTSYGYDNKYTTRGERISIFEILYSSSTKRQKPILKYCTIPKYGEDSSWEELSDAKKNSGCRC